MVTDIEQRQLTAINVTINVTDVVNEGGTRTRRDHESQPEARPRMTGSHRPTTKDLSTVDAKPTFPDVSATRSFPGEHSHRPRISARRLTATIVAGGPLSYTIGRRGRDVVPYRFLDRTAHDQGRRDLRLRGQEPAYAVTVTATGPSNAGTSISVTINVENVD